MEHIKPATPDDIPQLVNLLNLLFAQEADFTPDREKQRRGLELIIGSPEVGILFAAHEADQIVGMVSLLFTISTAEGGRACWLEDMVVRPDRRGAGLGSRLLDHAVVYARAHEFRRITLLTDQSNFDAMRFYQRAGFRQSAMTALRLELVSE